MDGVLVDSGDYHYRAWRETLDAQRRMPISVEDFRRTFGLRNSEMLRGFLGADLTDAAIDELATAKEEHYRRHVRDHGIQPLPGVLAWLDHLHLAGWRHAVASSAPRLNLEAILDAIDIGGYFDALVTAEDVSHGKPDPEVFLTAARRLGIPRDRCIVVEDAPAGVEGARRAGMVCIGVLTTHEHLDADITVRSLQDLPFTVADWLIERHIEQP
jgi:beta-phosphoglucomutase